MKAWIAGFLCVLGLLAVPLSYGQKRLSDDLNLEIKTAKGVIVSVDPPKLTVVVRGADEKDATFLVPLRAKIFKDTELVGFLKLEKDDEVTVKYFIDTSGVATVTSITIDNSIETQKK